MCGVACAVCVWLMGLMCVLSMVDCDVVWYVRVVCVCFCVVAFVYAVCLMCVWFV